MQSMQPHAAQCLEKVSNAMRCKHLIHRTEIACLWD